MFYAKQGGAVKYIFKMKFDSALMFIFIIWGQSHYLYSCWWYSWMGTFAIYSCQFLWL